jgi:hypothetical protein
MWIKFEVDFLGSPSPLQFLDPKISSAKENNGV